ncbi:U3-containing_90S pre-ribosomal complex subunit [Hexamita inflata]|uniref:U3-containing 90S pre-ribosomal complex subunit n=1 Tax=Hexamita inflata TaxID=28002 RepID=A0AA86Q8Y8_9EUKA|nr:U3-containing 90S pre-ribosomal complex subunit [Hexamita inflata]CAI9954495.1 U3-containing 90S pre-ribosomal complex subunit [Hexamita inflata]CAI9976912.1 U3-containing 90S pre-ribosomal complex subunit [Hexamita inflata]
MKPTFAEKLAAKAEQVKPNMKAKDRNPTVKQQKVIPEDPREAAKKLRAQEKQRQLVELLIRKGIRVPANYTDDSFNASDFVSKLLQKTTVAYTIPKQTKLLEKVKIKTAVQESYKPEYIQRISDMFHWFERKINFTAHTEQQFQRRQQNLTRSLIQAKLKLKSTTEQVQQKFDNLQDTTKYEVTQTIKPTFILLTQNAYRCLDFEQIFKLNSQMYTFFTKHYPIAVQVEMINQKCYENCKFVVGTASRILKLVQVGSLQVENVKHFVIDAGYLDDNEQTPFEYDEARADLRVFAQTLLNDTKVWVL